LVLSKNESMFFFGKKYLSSFQEVGQHLNKFFIYEFNDQLSRAMQ
jgi:hypothetical protein